MVNKSPIHYWAQTEQERVIYSGCYGIVPVVNQHGPYLGVGDRYVDPLMVCLVHLHEYVHNLFSYPYSLDDVTEKDFDLRMQEAEAAASNFSEVVVYYVEPKLVELTAGAYFRPGWFDRLQELGYRKMPKIAQLHAMRRTWLSDPETWSGIFAPEDYIPEGFVRSYNGLRDYMQRFVKGNEDFNVSRMHRLFGIEGFDDPCLPSLQPTSYFGTIDNFNFDDVSENVQTYYERNQLAHIKLLYNLFNIPNPPQSFQEAFERQGELDNVSFIL